MAQQQQREGKKHAQAANKMLEELQFVGARMKSEKRTLLHQWKGKKQHERIGWNKKNVMSTHRFWYDCSDVLMPVHQLQCQTMLLFLYFVLYFIHWHAKLILFGWWCCYCCCCALLVESMMCSKSFYLQAELTEAFNYSHRMDCFRAHHNHICAIIVCFFSLLLRSPGSFQLHIRLVVLFQYIISLDDRETESQKANYACASMWMPLCLNDIWL